MKTSKVNPVLTMRPDPDLVNEAKRRGINLRELLEESLRKKLKETICTKCGRPL